MGTPKIPLISGNSHMTALVVIREQARQRCGGLRATARPTCSSWANSDSEAFKRHVGVILGGVLGIYLGIMENKMETTRLQAAQTHPLATWPRQASQSKSVFGPETTNLDSALTVSFTFRCQAARVSSTRLTLCARQGGWMC